MRFLVFVPTIRGDAISENVRTLHASFDHPTDLIVMDGTPGLAACGNRVRKLLADPVQYDLVVKIDDNLVVPPGWQSQVVAAFDEIPRLGALGLDYSHWTSRIGFSADGAAYMGVINPLVTRGSVRYREVSGTIAGKFLARPARLVRRSRPVPLGGLPASMCGVPRFRRALSRLSPLRWLRERRREPLRYNFYDDMYMCNEVLRLGYSLAYLATDPVCRISYPAEPSGYIERKVREIRLAGGPDLSHLVAATAD